MVPEPFHRLEAIESRWYTQSCDGAISILASRSCTDAIVDMVIETLNPNRVHFVLHTVTVKVTAELQKRDS